MGGDDWAHSQFTTSGGRKMGTTAGMFGNPAAATEKPSGPVWGEWGAPVTKPGVYLFQERGCTEFDAIVWMQDEIDSSVHSWSKNTRYAFYGTPPDSISEPPAPEPLPKIIEVEHLVGRHPEHGSDSFMRRIGGTWIERSDETVLTRQQWHDVGWSFEPRPSE